MNLACTRPLSYTAYIDEARKRKRGLASERGWSLLPSSGKGHHGTDGCSWVAGVLVVGRRELHVLGLLLLFFFLKEVEG